MRDETEARRHGEVNTLVVPAMADLQLDRYAMSVSFIHVLGCHPQPNDVSADLTSGSI